LGSSGVSNALLLLKVKKARGTPRRTWIDDLLQWTQKNKYHEVKKTDRGQEDIEKQTNTLFCKISVSLR